MIRKIILALILLVASSSGTAVLAANAAVPGDPLYGIDRALENLRFQLASNPQAAAELQVSAVTERLEEIQELLARGDQVNLESALSGLDQTLVQSAQPLAMPQAVAEEPELLPEAESEGEIAQEDPDEAPAKVESARCQDGEEGTNPAAGQLAEVYGVSPEDVMALFCKGYGFGEIKLAYEIAAQSEIAPLELFEMRAGGMGWGKIMQEAGLIGKDKGEAAVQDDETGDEPEEGLEEEALDEEGGKVLVDNEGHYCLDISSEPHHPEGDKLAEAYGVNYEAIMGWFCSGFGFGEIALAYDLSLMQSDETVEDIFARRATQGWGEIKQDLGVTGNPHAVDAPQDESGVESQPEVQPRGNSGSAPGQNKAGDKSAGKKGGGKP